VSVRVSSAQCITALTARGFDRFTGVPCSFLRPFIDRVIDDPRLEYIAATNEGEALAIASGIQLAGRRSVVMLQNSGLGNLVNPLASLNAIFRIPVLLIITLRGEPGRPDEPQHALMGRATHALLDALEIAHARFPDSDAEIDARLDAACAHMEATGLPYALILRKDVVDEYEPGPRQTPASPSVGAGPTLLDSGKALHDAAPMPVRRDAIALIADHAGDALLIATTGKTGRELFEHRDAPHHFYVVGSMGCASSLALGVARGIGDPVIVLDGDGAALMRLEAMATIGHEAPPNLVHVILDNGAYESTGAQATISRSISFPAIATACGYATARTARGSAAITAALADCATRRGPHLIHVPVAIAASPNLARPSVAPPEVARRFREEIARRRAVT
jgi:phosphonopyruvate decarboxylase